MANWIAFIFMVFGVLACGETKEQAKKPQSEPPSVTKTPDNGDDSQVADEDDDPDTSETKPGDRTMCKAPEGADTSPETIEEVVALINAMPKPVSIACLMDVLQRPLYLNATASELSVQPALGESTPRIFLFQGSSLIMTFVPAGEGSKAIEFSFLLSNRTSVKGEIPFPVTAELPDNAAYATILARDGNGTTCSGCHGFETRMGAPFADGAFSSTALKPFKTRDVTLFKLEREVRLCKGQPGARCDILEAIFGGGDVFPKSFPDDMGTLF